MFKAKVKNNNKYVKINYKKKLEFKNKNKKNKL